MRVWWCCHIQLLSRESIVVCRSVGVEYRYAVVVWRECRFILVCVNVGMFWYLLYWCESRYILGVKVGIFFLNAVVQPKFMKQRSVVRHAPLAKYIQCNVRGIISFNCSEKRETRVTFVEIFYLG